MNTYQVKQDEYRRKRPRNRLLVRGGVIVDHAAKLAATYMERVEQRTETEAATNERNSAN